MSRTKSMHSAGFAKQRDKNEPDIVRALEAVGASVTRLNQLGVPDLLVGFASRTYLLEVKNAKGKLNENQVDWWKVWNGDAPAIVRTVEEALTIIGLQIVSPGMYIDRLGHVKTYPRAKESKK